MEVCVIHVCVCVCAHATSKRDVDTFLTQWISIDGVLSWYQWMVCLANTVDGVTCRVVFAALVWTFFQPVDRLLGRVLPCNCSVKPAWGQVLVDFHGCVRVVAAHPHQYLQSTPLSRCPGDC